MPSLKELLVKESILRNRLDKLIENGKKTALHKRTQGFFETRIADLKKTWENYGTVDMSINESLSEVSAEESNAYLEADNYGIAELKYSEYMSELMEGLRKFSTTVEANEISPPVHTTTVIQQESVLPRISLPKYNGDYDLWRSFHDLFVALVHNNSRLTPVQKLHHLKTCLVGEAEKVLRHTPITNEDYEPAWNKLKGRYENKRILVNHQLKTLLNQPKQNSETSKGIKSLLDTTEECLQQLKSLDIDTSSWDVLLIHILVQKLPFMTLKLWEEDQGATQDLPKFTEFSTFLNTRLKILESIADAVITKQPQSKSVTKQTTLACYTSRGSRCPACDGNHYVQRCPKYLKMNVEARRKIIKISGRCLNCLSNEHTLNECTSKYKCFKCNQKHHSTLHENLNKEQTSNTTWKNKSNMYEHTTVQNQHDSTRNQIQHNNIKQASNIPTRLQSTDVDGLNTTQTFVTRENHHALLSTALVIAKSKFGEPTILRCLVDSGSQSSFITEAACKKLSATRTPTSVAITGLNTSPAAMSCQQTTLQLRSCGSNPTILEEDFLVLKGITNSLPTKLMSRRHYPHLNGLPLADPTFWKPGKIDALLGARIYAKIVQDGIRRGPDTAPTAINTMFGWILLGSNTEGLDDKTASFTSIITNDELNAQLKRFWELEELPTQTILNQKEEECQRLYQSTYRRLSNGKYQVKLPFLNNEVPTLGQSRPQALKRFFNLQRQFVNNTQLEKDYRNCLNEYIELGHMEEVSIPDDTEPHYYIPHHAVFKDSTTTKLRVVFDASARTTSGKSINDYLLKGPTLQPKLFATLLNWRKYKIAMNADIEKMYRMIEVHPEQRTFQRIIWQHPITMKLQDYQLKTVTFGTSSAPYLAVRTLQQLAEDESINWPLASKATFTDFYVDDLLTGADNIADAKRLQVELLNMMKAGGFNLRKWASNEPKLLEDIPMDHREVKGALTFAEDESVKTLGIRWHPAFDYFTFTITPRNKHTIITKRTILSEVASLYDPLGWLAPVIIVAKMLMQALWITGCSWDNPVTDSIKAQWENFKTDLEHLQLLKIPRWIQYSTHARMQLHGFCDASTKAYAAVLYLRVEREDGSIATTLLTAKTRVAPTKPITIPRLELNGAVILARLIKTTIKDMQLQHVPVFAWTDAMIVLQWIKEHPSRWKTYVANRVVEIQDIVRYDCWQHIATTHNPADLASRGTSSSSLIHDNLWWHGPQWLSQKEDKWPKANGIQEQTNLEAKQSVTNTFLNKLEDDVLLRYSSFSQLIRVIATVQRFIHNCRNPQDKRLESLNSAEWNTAETTVFKLVQQICFQEDYCHLMHNKPLSRSSRLLKLNPFIDTNGLIRVGGRLDNAMISYTRRHPIILPQTHHVTLILIDKMHCETLHGGPSLVLSTSREKYWILDARRAITSRLHKCVICAKQRSITATQLMGNLPSPRVNITKPFSRVGIDYAGPVTLKVSSHRNAKRHKAYFCIFVCMVTKAIHIELVSDLTSEAFIAALKRFVSRRGLCSDIYSDCGTNFVGGKSMLDKDLAQAIRQSTPKAAQYLVSKAVTWHFNPPAAPHFGGIWEAGVKSIKHHLRRTVGNLICTFEEYATVLAQIEACLNSRPLCHIRNDPDELFVLTPGHFLIGRALNAIVEPDYSTTKILPSQRWKLLQQANKLFWDKWSKDYLNQLQHRPKWLTKQPNIQIGDVVVIKNEQTAPGNWPLGVIEEIYPGKDGLVRVAKVRTQHSTFQRPITRICRLPIDELSSSDET